MRLALDDPGGRMVLIWMFAILAIGMGVGPPWLYWTARWAVVMAMFGFGLRSRRDKHRILPMPALNRVGWGVLALVAFALAAGSLFSAVEMGRASQRGEILATVQWSGLAVTGAVLASTLLLWPRPWRNYPKLEPTKRRRPPVKPRRPFY